MVKSQKSVEPRLPIVTRQNWLSSKAKTDKTVPKRKRKLTEVESQRATTCTSGRRGSKWLWCGRLEIYIALLSAPWCRNLVIWYFFSKSMYSLNLLLLGSI